MSSTITIKGCTGNYGLDHAMSNLHAAIRYAAHMNRLLVLPKFTLEGKHNNKKMIRNCDLLDYYDLLTVTINNKPVFTTQPSEDNIIVHMRNVLWRKDSKVTDTPPVDVHIKYTPEIESISENLRLSIGDYNCIHVRMTDHGEKHKMTQTNILNAMNKTCDINLPVYIMTDHPDKKYFDPLKNNGWELIFYDDYKHLINLKKIDNYKLYCVETNLRLKANKSLSANDIRKNFN